MFTLGEYAFIGSTRDSFAVKSAVSPMSVRLMSGNGSSFVLAHSVPSVVYVFSLRSLEGHGLLNFLITFSIELY